MIRAEAFLDISIGLTVHFPEQLRVLAYEYVLIVCLVAQIVDDPLLLLDYLKDALGHLLVELRLQQLVDAVDVRIVILNGLVLVVQDLLLDFNLLEGVVNLKAYAGVDLINSQMGMARMFWMRLRG